MWDSKVIELDYMGIKSDRISYGNRYLGMDRKVTIPQASAYKDILRENRVVAVREERRGMILTQFEELFKDSIYKVREDERLLDTVCNLVEYPTL
jgi:glycyl-tRNA synthetase beta chain